MAKPVAIIGSSCRFPGGADSPSKLWELLQDPTDVLKEFPPERLNLKSFYHEKGEHHGSTDVRNKSYLLEEDLRHFDASFFRISPSEADCMDPQQRILLETVYEALESAGCTLDQMRGSLTSVYAGLMNGDYADIQIRDVDLISTHHGTGTHRSILANRISYFLDIKGASMTIDTACSSSLVALHQAVQSLRLGESDMAIVVGANLLIDPAMYVAESKLHMLSPDSRSRMWDQAADGYARGEGFAAIVLKPLDRAISNADHIECLIRATAVNSDGRTAGITVPSPAAQTELIRSAYKVAGLNPVKDRCQYFEAHGTGTSAGDPIEARAIRDAFFPADNSRSVEEDSEKLFVGSIKTVLGHLEGCAGLAGILKATLAMQHRMIPPNLHFSKLSPEVAPFYHNLHVPTKATQWPEVPAGIPLRVSVNSFGFGGTNAHAILETFQGDDHATGSTPLLRRSDIPTEDFNQGNESFVGPLLFSANTKDSLVRLVQAHATYIRANKLLDLADLSWTLQFRRTQFANHRTFFSGATRQRLLSYMDAYVAENMTTAPSAAPSGGSGRSQPPPMLVGDDRPAILGIFTGQGAQWPSMGRNLILRSPLFHHSISRCEASLQTLGIDAPEWSLMQEMLAEGHNSRVTQASISQPLCTAVQIGLVDLLRASGISLSSVVGHSSGEIAAVYAAGIISAQDAIRIAYYRGFHTHLAKGPNDEQGAMMAAGLSFESATNLCSRPEYQGRICVAAANSPTSVTISGDLDAVDEVMNELNASNTFVRKLNVNTAYHSHHMTPCASAYLASLKKINIQVQAANQGCVWVSSVQGDAEFATEGEEGDEHLESLKGRYWVDNLLAPVLFAPAVERSLWTAGPFDAVTEVGPHPALKGPTTQIFKASLGSSLPYFSIMRRGDHEVEALSGGLGYLWEHFGAAALIDFDGYRQAFAGPEARPPRLVKGLPSYPWEHGREYWRESRVSQNFRLNDRPTNEILGRRAADDTNEFLRWRNILRPSEIPWVRDHAFQGQMVLPGASYVAAIVEVTRVVAADKRVKLVELFDVKIPKAVVLQENMSTELITTVGSVVYKRKNLISAEFCFSACSADSLTRVSPEKTCSGRVEIHVSETALPHLPLPGPPPPNLNNLDVGIFYETLQGLGINYQGNFRATKSAQRSLGYAQTLSSWTVADLGSSFSLHPAILDIGFQSVLAAIASPQTGQMRTVYLPIGIRRATIHMDSLPHCSTASGMEITAQSTALITASSAKAIAGSVQIMFGSHIGVQVEGVELHATGAAQAAGDLLLFSNTIWEPDISSGFGEVGLERPSDPSHEDKLLEALGRTSLYYYQKLLDEIPIREVKTLAWHKQMYWQSAKHWVDEVRAGRHQSVRCEWLNDTRDAVWEQAKGFEDTVDIRITRSLGEKLASIVRGETQPLEIMMEDDMLSRFYVESYGLDSMNDYIARAVGQICHRYPQANILEIGAGSGGTTRKALRAVGNAFSHYTFTDISSGFFEKGAAKFDAWRHKMTFKVCNIENDPVEQGFEEEAYDIIVAANVLHATRCLAETMRNVRKLLKPGGYLIMMEITGDLLRLGFIMGTLPGWWLGPQIGDEGRCWAPGISTVQWDGLLRRTGFSGVDQVATNNPAAHKHYVSALVSQAVDDVFVQLRDPLGNLTRVPRLSHRLVILGGETLTTSKLIKHIKRILLPLTDTIDVVYSLSEFSIYSLSEFSIDQKEEVSIISLTELDQPLFARHCLSRDVLQNLQKLLDLSSSILWVTTGCRASNPIASMFVGIARALLTERGDINLQLLDIENISDVSPVTLSEFFLRLVLTKQEEYSEKHMLWSTEREVALKGETLLISRLIPDKERNERYNASHRTIEKDVTLKTSEIEIDTEGEIASLLSVERSFSRCLMATSTPDHTILDVQLSVALGHSENKLFLCYGTLRSKDANRALTVYNVNKSSIPCDPHCILQLESTFPQDDAAELLEAIAGQLMVRALASNIPHRGDVLVFNPPGEGFAIALQSSRLWTERNVFFATSRIDSPARLSWITIHPQELSQTARKKIPRDIAVVVDFSSPIHRNIREFAPKNAVIRRYEPSLLKVTSDELAIAYVDATVAVNRMGRTRTRVLSLRDLAGSPCSALTYPVVVDWTEQPNATISAKVKPLMPSGIFSASKTHLMVGLNGDLGQSLCSYMIRNGARHIAITSRRGQVNPKWLESVQQDYQVDVQVFKMDVSNQPSIRSALELISTKMPPIGGVANGALVLHDMMFLNMDAESLNDTLKPKVDGSRYLDESFGSQTLDYFVLFSSVGTVGGNRGQGNYHAANMFMTSLAANRRTRGLAASVIHMGMVLDVGYVARQDPKLYEHMRKQGFMPTSESDAHFLWAEGVLASPVDSQLDADICMGFEAFEDAGDPFTRPPWYNDPRLSHFVTQVDDNRSDIWCGINDVVSIRKKLDGVKSIEEAQYLIQETFSAKLEAMMQLELGSLNSDVPLLDLGFDSLLAVETRTWFLKEVHIDVPVLRFLGGDTTREICKDVAMQYLAFKKSQQLEKESAIPTATVAVAASAASVSKVGNNMTFTEEDAEKSSLLASPTLMSESDEVSQAASISTPSSLGTEPLPKTSKTRPSSIKPQYSVMPESSTNIPLNKPSPTQIADTGTYLHSQEPFLGQPSRTERMSYAQSRLWFLDQYLDDRTTCNIAVQYAISGPLVIEKLREALNRVITHHPGLRMCFYEDEDTGEPMQGMLRTMPPSMALKHLHASSTDDIQREFDTLRNREWDLAHGETFAATLFSTENKNKHIIVFGYHHIIIDGVSWHTILQDLHRAYDCQPLSRQRKLYMDAATEQRASIECGHLENEIAFWQSVHEPLPDVLPLFPMASTQSRRPLRSCASHSVTLNMSSKLVSKVKSASKSLGVTPFHFYLATMQLLLFRFLNVCDVCIGVTDASRYDESNSLNNTVGFFLNMLPLRLKLTKEESFVSLVHRACKHAIEGQSNGRVPIDVILNRLNVPRDSSICPLFQTTFNYRVGALAETSLGMCELSVEKVCDAQGPFDLGFGIYESSEGSCGLQVVMQASLYDSDSAECIGQSYLHLIGALIDDTSLSLEEYPLYDTSSVELALRLGKGPRRAWDWPGTFSERINKMIGLHMKSKAIVDGVTNESLTYEELGRMVHILVSEIQQKEPPQGSRIAVLCELSTDLVLSILAILQVGLVYVPLDSNLPADRHRAILLDCQPAVLLCHDKTLEPALSIGDNIPIVNLSISLTTSRFAYSSRDPNPTGGAFLLYTSGSTGKPKGIQLPQSGLLNHIALKTEALSLGREVVLQQSSIGFDMSLTQIFVALTNGGILVIAPKVSRGDPVALSHIMLTYGVTFIIATPSEQAMLLRHGRVHLEQCSLWRHACMGGETVTPQLVRAFAELGNSDLRLTNCYGPTEASLAVTFANVPLESTASATFDYGSVGKVLPNLSIYILAQESAHSMPVGFVGEICIGGSGVGMGYLNLPDISAAKFVHDSFADECDRAKGWTRMFRTGDRGRLRLDGSLVFMGRTGSDSMVKLRGLRIDLEDVANTLAQSASDLISEAVVIVRGEEEETKSLVAYVVPHLNQSSELRKVCYSRGILSQPPLPVYMRPSIMVVVDMLPHTPNGKVDRRAIEAEEFPPGMLESACLDGEEKNIAEKLSLEEGELSLLWDEVLGASATSARSELTPDSDFFMVGGSSLLLMQLQGAIKDTLGLSVSIADLYQASTLRLMATHLGRQKWQDAPQCRIDWDTETKYDALPSVSSSVSCASNATARNKSHREVLLTGAHTFLGTEILRALLDDNEIKRVHCVALPRAASKTLPLSGRILSYPGSLQSKFLGLSPSDVSRLQSCIDLIVHADSVGHCLNNYWSLRHPNVSSIRFLVDLALPRQIPVHMVSSNRVTLLSGHNKLPPVSLSNYYPPTDGSEGLTASKWAAEHLLENVSRLTGLQVTIHRPCAVVGPGAPIDDALNSLLKFAESQKTVPRFKNLTGFLDFAPVTAVARHITRVVLEKAQEEGLVCPMDCVTRRSSPTTTCPVSIVHYSSNVETPVDEFRACMERIYGCPFSEVDIKEWIADSVKAGMDPLISTYLEAVVEKDQAINFPYLGVPLMQDSEG